jgi:hypothetical protein
LFQDFPPRHAETPQTEADDMFRPERTVRSVSRRFSLAFIGVVTLVLIFFAGIAIYLDISRINAKLEKRLENALQLAKISLRTPLWNLDDSTVGGFVEALFLDEAMVYAEVKSEENVITRKVNSKIQDKSLKYLKESPQFIDKFSNIFYEENR